MPLFCLKNNLPKRQVLSPKVAKSATFKAFNQGVFLNGFCIGFVLDQTKEKGELRIILVQFAILIL
jgi:hypothetical protein